MFMESRLLPALKRIVKGNRLLPPFYSEYIPLNGIDYFCVFSSTLDDDYLDVKSFIHRDF
jgi:hypothetical protein